MGPGGFTIAGFRFTICIADLQSSPGIVICGPEGIRTPDLLSAIEARSQLRYRPGEWAKRILPEAGGDVKRNRAGMRQANQGFSVSHHSCKGLTCWKMTKPRPGSASKMCALDLMYNGKCVGQFTTEFREGNRFGNHVIAEVEAFRGRF